VLSSSWGSGDGGGSDVGAASVAHGRAVAGRLRVGVMVHCHHICWRCAIGAAGSRRRDGRGALATVATVRELVKVQAAGKFGLLQVCSDMFVRHLLHAGLKEVVFLEPS
jgi:hypothetical protein